MRTVSSMTDPFTTEHERLVSLPSGVILDDDADICQAN